MIKVTTLRGMQLCIYKYVHSTHKGESTKIVELKGKQTLMPGIIDPHSHPACVSSFKFLETISAFSGEFNTPEKVLAKVSRS